MKRVNIREKILHHAELCKELADLAIKLDRIYKDGGKPDTENSRKFRLLQTQSQTLAMEIGTALRDGTAHIPSTARRHPRIKAILDTYTKYVQNPNDDTHNRIITILLGTIGEEEARSTITGTLMRYQ